jgi:hypothetical protein
MPTTLAFILALSAMPQPARGAEQIFQCAFGAKQVEVVRDGTTLTYRFGRLGRPELVISGDAASGNIHYHRTLYPHGEDQTLRFTRGIHSYVIFNAFQTPDYRQEGARDDSGLLVLRNGRRIARLNCRGGGDFIEFPIFEALPQDEVNLVPRDQ